MRRFVSGFLIFCLFVSVFLFICRYQFMVVSGNSMYSTLENEDLLIINRNAVAKRGDIVVVYSSVLDKTICKRVIGVGNDLISVNSKTITVNGVALKEDYAVESDLGSFSILVPDGYLYLLGDNRPVSNDSRSIGCVPESDLIGVFVFNITDKTSFRIEHFTMTLCILWLLFALSIFITTKRRNKEGEEDE